MLLNMSHKLIMRQTDASEYESQTDYETDRASEYESQTYYETDRRF